MGPAIISALGSMMSSQGGQGGQGGGGGGMDPIGSMQTMTGASRTGDMLAGIMGLLDYQNPTSAAMPYLGQIQAKNDQYLGGYNQMGQQAGQNLMGQYGQMMSNPGNFINQIGSSYHQSPGFQFALHQALMGANQGAAAGGMAGSPLGQQTNMGIATQLGNQDYYNYLKQALGQYNQGLQGEQGMFGMGELAGTDMANNVTQGLSDQAAYAYAGANNENQNKSNSWGDIIGSVF